MEEDSYTMGQAARILKVTDRGVRTMIDRGELEARQDERGRHLIPQRAVHAMLEEQRSIAGSGAVGAGNLEISGEEAARASEEARELRERVQDLQRQLGRVEGRLELTERTESTMREERERLERLLEEERTERRRLQERLEEAQQRERDAARPWWRRMFGG